MKTMSISKIALALLISVPALTLNGAATLTAAFTPKVSLLGRLNDMTQKGCASLKKGCGSLWAKTKSAFNTSVSYVQKNPKTVAKGAGIAAAALATGYGVYRLGKFAYNSWYAPKPKEEAVVQKQKVVVAPTTNPANPQNKVGNLTIPATPYQRRVAGPTIFRHN